MNGMLAMVCTNLVTAADETGWDLTSFLNNAKNSLVGWGGIIVSIIGVIMIIVSVYKMAIGFISHGKTQTNWVIVIALLIVGGALMAGGWTIVTKFAAGGQKTLTDLGDGNGGTTSGTVFVMPNAVNYTESGIPDIT